ncbi:MAG: VOC family protein [Thermoleophilia bacterium]|nr:VOC family protein [Thermoleophilia bacterium]
MNTFHLSLNVPDLDRSVAFYSRLFGMEPAKRKPGYAKFELADPPVALALNASGSPGLSHLGVRVASTAEVESASLRLAESGLVTLDERDTTCCYARQDKVWVHDPAGHPWEIYTLLEDVEEAMDEERAATCCSGAEAHACC